MSFLCQADSESQATASKEEKKVAQYLRFNLDSKKATLYGNEAFYFQGELYLFLFELLITKFLCLVQRKLNQWLTQKGKVDNDEKVPKLAL